MPRYTDARNFNHAAVEKETLDWWNEREIFARSLSEREGAPSFVFYEGPPTANGKPGIHHVMARTIKDLFCRYRTMKGFRVDRKAGWDTHGLPVEIEVEKELGLEGRHQVEEYGVAAYNAACRKSVLRYKDLWDTLTQRMGYWVDLSDPYVTFENRYIESVWNLLKRISERQTESGESFLYRGHKIQWYSPGSGTVLSSHEVSLGYKEVQDPSVFVRFPVHGEENTFFLAWTTTPWTLPSNTALAVHPRVEYIKVRLKNENSEIFYLAKARLEVIKEEVEILEELPGSELIGKTYDPPFDVFKDGVGEGEAWRVVPADFVTTEDGTGIVHMAPAFGADDFAVAGRENLPVFNPVAPDGRFTDRVKLVEGQWFKDADKLLAKDLRERGLMYRHETSVHNYPHDWRKGTPLMSYPVESWFIRTTAVKSRLVELNNTINWQPEGIGKGRFGQWLENNVDWAISRMRYWGTPIPIWINDRNQDDYIVIGSLEELKERVGGELPLDAINPETGEADLHRPYVDSITFPAADGGTYRRIPDLLDVWFDSGAMPFAQWHFPFENQEIFERNFPADFIAEGVDQTRGWFYTLHAIATLVSDSVAYRNVVVNGLVLDEKGEKMSKSKGNTVDPFVAIERHGVDPLRWMMMSSSTPWDNLRYADKAVEETSRKLFGTVTNTYQFFATYANIDGYTYSGDSNFKRSELDNWILSRLQNTIRVADESLEAYHPTHAARAMETFVDDLSNWHIRRSRRRFWKATDDGDKKAAYATVYECLLGIAKLMAPIAPFYAEWLYGVLQASEHGPDSVHLCDFLVVDESLIDADLEERMALARRVASLALALRNEAGINVRQPLKSLAVVVGLGGVDESVLRTVEDIVREEVNIKRIDPIPATSELVARSARPNFKTLGRRLGKLMKPAGDVIRALSGEDIAIYEASGNLTLTVEDESIELAAGDLEIVSEGVPGYLVAQEEGVTVSLDTTITEDLRAEGLAREFVNRVQNLRKQADFEVSDRIVVNFSSSSAFADAVLRHAAVIQTETLARVLDQTEEPTGELVETFDISGESVLIGVRREH